MVGGCKGNFTKELEKNLAQHRFDEKIMRYKWEAYKKNFQIFICGNPTSTKVSSQDEKTEVGPNGIVQEEKTQTKDFDDLKNGVAQKEEVQLEIPHDFRGGGQEEKDLEGIQEHERWRFFQHQKKRYPRYNVSTQNHKLNYQGRKLELHSKMQI